MSSASGLLCLLYLHGPGSGTETSGEEVKVHDSCFAAGIQDLIWLRVVGRNGWVVLTKDSRIRYRRNEMEALLSSGVRSFVLVTNPPVAEIFLLRKKIWFGLLLRTFIMMGKLFS